MSMNLVGPPTELQISNQGPSHIAHGSNHSSFLQQTSPYTQDQASLSGIVGQYSRFASFGARMAASNLHSHGRKRLQGTSMSHR